MAKKKASSQAEKIVTDTKRKAPPAKSVSKKKPPKKAAKSKNAPKVGTEYENPISSSAVTALISFCLFLLFVLICVKPEGALLMVVRSVVLGCVGRAGFYFLIPALLYTAVINLFGRKIAVRMRGTCAIAFALLCGVIYHLVVSAQVQLEPMQLLTSLYTGGAAGTSGGVLCGGAAYLLRWACGTALAYIISMLCAVLTLLGAMQITVPSLIRAIANRPRDDYEEDEEDDYIEPAAIVVNKIANRQIEQKRQRREQAKAQPVFPPEPEESAQERMPEPPRKKEKRQPAPPAAPVEPVDTVKHAPGKGADFMSRIDVEISAPLAGTSRYVHEDIPNVFDDPISEPVSVPEEPEIPQKMPELVVEHKKTVQVKPAPRKKPEPEPQPEPEPEKVTAKDTAAATKQVSAEIAQNQAKTVPEYCFPPIDLLKRPTRAAADGTEEMRENSRRLNETLASFNIDAHIINVTRGPSVTRYEVELDRGVRLNKLTGCADDIALSLGASGVRIAAVPGKISVVGIEVPNRTVTTVSLREVIDSNEFANAKSKSSVALGKSIDGACVVGNIAKMPHLLIAGTTGSGKSVCMNSIIISLLYKAGPEDIKLIMVDPKMVELGIYNGIPQLLIPVVTDPKKAAGSLQWAVTEMLRRYKMMSDLGVRDLESYNSIVVNEEDGQKLPSIVVIIDELADLMMVAAKEVEDSICRIAQMGRAAGMHLIIATQRPSANVITGLMKANIPSRIAFSVASAMESRIILDTMGAEKLVGKGDMLYAPIGSGKPLRVQGCFVTDGEVEAVAEYVKEHYVADYNQDVLDEIEKKAQQTGKKPTSVSDSEPSDEELEGDEMLPAAVDVILETGQASVSMLQRRLKLGYARAARIVDEMEEKGIVGPFQGSKPRAILITKEQWQAQKGGGQMDFDDLSEEQS
ncbi:MAG: DNA translocase FtsK [Candidatus Faecousia sp.]|nr:DNA translocase FtsK [Clostridiales bacterium]MDY4598304.1 DNA translocase FtsK [Candidatus Faecousia sp.]